MFKLILNTIRKKYIKIAFVILIAGIAATLIVSCNKSNDDVIISGNVQKFTPAKEAVPDLLNLNNYLKNQRFYRKGIQGETTNHVSLNLFPNPASGIITIEFEAEPDATDLNLLISDIIGTPCFSMDISTNKGLKQISADEFKPGVYFVSLMNATRPLVTKRLMIIN